MNTLGRQLIHFPAAEEMSEEKVKSTPLQDYLPDLPALNQPINQEIVYIN